MLEKPNDLCGYLTDELMVMVLVYEGYTIKQIAEMFDDTVTRIAHLKKQAIWRAYRAIDKQKAGD